MISRAVAAALCGAVLLAVPAAAQQPAEPSHEELVKRAKEEGRVTWYVSIPAVGSQAVADAFMKKYPEIKVDVQRLGGFGLWERLSSEFSAGVHNADVYSQADYGVRLDAAKRGIIAKYNPPSAAKYPANLVDPEGYGFSTRIVATAIAYNTDLVAPEDAPKSWSDLLDPKWADKKIGTGDPRASGFSSAAYQQMAAAPDIGKPFFEKLAAQKPVLFEDSGQQINALVIGEYPIVVLLDYRPWEFMEKGAPVKVVYPADGVGWGSDYTHLVAKAPHPNAAKLLMDFYASAEAAELVAKNLRTYVAVPGIPAYPEGYGRPSLAELKMLPSNPPQEAANSDAFNEWWASTFK